MRQKKERTSLKSNIICRRSWLRYLVCAIFCVHRERVKHLLRRPRLWLTHVGAINCFVSVRRTFSLRPDSEVVSYKTDEGRGEFPRERNKPVEKSTLNTIYPKSTAHVHIVYVSLFIPVQWKSISCERRALVWLSHDKRQNDGSLNIPKIHLTSN